MTTHKVPAPPAGLKAPGRALWRSVLRDYELDEHEVTVLLEACRTRDSITDLQVVLDQEGVMNTGPQGVRVHPALPELRQQRITFARLITALRIPAGLVEDRTQQRGAVRGVYPLRGVSS